MASGDDRDQTPRRADTLSGPTAPTYRLDNEDERYFDSNPVETSRAENVDGPSVAGLHSASPSEEMYDSDSEMSDAMEDEGGVPIAPYMEDDADLETVMRRLDDARVLRQHGLTASESGSEYANVEHLPAADTVTSYSGSDGEGAQNVGEEDDSVQTQHVDHSTSDLDAVENPYEGFDYESLPQATEVPMVQVPGDHSYNFSDGDDPEMDIPFSESVIHAITHERNLTVDQFINQWLVQSTTPQFRHMLPHGTPTPQSSGLTILTWMPPTRILRPSKYPKDFFDIQQIPWWEFMRVKRSDARALRDACYTSYHNLEYFPGYAKRLPDIEQYYRGKSMYTKYKATIEHFQLRNLMSVVSHNTVEFAHESKLYSWIPAYDEITCLMDLSRPAVESHFQSPVKISTMRSANDVSIVGGFGGEYALRAAGTDGTPVEGFATKDFNGITNHIDIVPHRTNRSPVAVIASNDKHLRLLDCETNTFIGDQAHSSAINCTSTSHDGRLRVAIGDSPDAWIIESDTGKPVQPLRGHRDFGFACAWSPDMRHIATSNQDKTVIIWDARTWRILETIESDVAGYRSLQFSPVGGGPRTLLLCEPADRISIVDAQTYQSRQVHDFFGEIGGADYTPDGGAIWVANADRHFGGFMEYSRQQWGSGFYGSSGLPSDWLPESELDDDERCVLSARERRRRLWSNLSDDEHDDLLL